MNGGLAVLPHEVPRLIARAHAEAALCRSYADMAVVPGTGETWAIRADLLEQLADTLYMEREGHNETLRDRELVRSAAEKRINQLREYIDRMPYPSDLEDTRRATSSERAS